jgi:hypothetical protein
VDFAGEDETVRHEGMVERFTGDRADLHGALKVVLGEGTLGYELTPESTADPAGARVADVPAGEEQGPVALGGVHM